MDCCYHKKSSKKCIRSKDDKTFSLPRRFSRNKCISSKVKGFSMKSSCAQYKYCKQSGSSKKRKKKKKKKQFLYNPNNPKKSFDVYIDKNPKDTINIKYTTVEDVKNTIKKLEKLYKSNKYTHKRIWQVGMIMKVRLEAMLKYKNTKFKNAKNVKSRYNLSKRYFEFLGKRTKTPEKDRRKLVFKIN